MQNPMNPHIYKTDRLYASHTTAFENNIPICYSFLPSKAHRCTSKKICKGSRSGISGSVFLSHWVRTELPKANTYLASGYAQMLAQV